MPTGPSERAEYADALLTGEARGRGAGLNPGNRHETLRLHVLGEHLDEVALERDGEPANVRTRVYRDAARSCINPVDSADLHFKWSFNPYRGCEHGCIYCYARPTHENLGLSCGLDFETKILAKLDAPAILRRELSRQSWKAENIMVSGVTDPYQPVERKLRLTRACLEVFAEFRQPVSIVTKNHLVTRDLDLLSELAKHNAVRVAVSVTTLDRSLAMDMEPRASSPADRLRAVRELSAAGVPVAVMVAPIVPGLTDHEIPAILKAAKEAGAEAAAYVLLRLPHQVKALFLDWLERRRPGGAAKIEAFIREARGGKLYSAEWGVRQRGEGERAAQIRRTFQVFARRYGLDGPGAAVSGAAFRVPDASGQLGLFL